MEKYPVQGKKTWSLKRLRFMHRRCASWHAVPLHTPTGVLHKTAFSDEALFHYRSTIWNIIPFHSIIWSTRFRSYDVRNKKMKVCPFVMFSVLLFVILPIILSEICKSRQLPSFFRTFYVCRRTPDFFVWAEKFSLFQQMSKTEIFSQFNAPMTGSD